MAPPQCGVETVSLQERVVSSQLDEPASVHHRDDISRDDVHSLIASGPSLRFLSEMNENALRNIENHWHKLFIGWQAILGQLKVRQQQMEAKSLMNSWFGRKRKP